MESSLGGAGAEGRIFEQFFGPEIEKEDRVALQVGGVVGVEARGGFEGEAETDVVA